jgi:hypothetical protein
MRKGGPLMICPRCKREIPGTREGKAAKPDTAAQPERSRRPDPEDAVRADRPPAPCPECGWSTMWNE